MITVVCEVTWSGKCRAWGAFGPHGCGREPGHDGIHVCPCGQQRPDHDPPEPPL